MQCLLYQLHSGEDVVQSQLGSRILDTCLTFTHWFYYSREITNSRECWSECWSECPATWFSKLLCLNWRNTSLLLYPLVFQLSHCWWDSTIAINNRLIVVSIAIVSFSLYIKNSRTSRIANYLSAPFLYSRSYQTQWFQQDLATNKAARLANLRWTEIIAFRKNLWSMVQPHWKAARLNNRVARPQTYEHSEEHVTKSPAMVCPGEHLKATIWLLKDGQPWPIDQLPARKGNGTMLIWRTTSNSSKSQSVGSRKSMRQQTASVKLISGSFYHTWRTYDQWNRLK